MSKRRPAERTHKCNKLNVDKTREMYEDRLPLLSAPHVAILPKAARGAGGDAAGMAADAAGASYIDLIYLLYV